ncbi:MULTISPECIES: hypothetical protein [Alphaproteobacteria]|uniref:Uncharacterized protein n=2 Tax=Alphaproteobacteria TaxID=28211 RepID=A0A512HHR6_9HYPH|nr:MULTISPECIES: hypothetical protein [Alphaproteobacteria]GEO84988.1 hypothetical protein RNA01_19200 [Ciceribacter naphthalenivorans]GLR22922.1 hypothetical protein GCM10007920_27100 [Ciceribacter naphthalenivorans]GLT05778.1 hypothetical protein GCM10007926_27100 [Sphingomonas psychrolutea]
MTQVVTVSATTAAYAMEHVKPQQRTSRSSFSDENTRLLAEQAATSEDFQLRALLNIVQPPALALYFLTAGQKNLAQASLKDTLEAYKNSAA